MGYSFETERLCLRTSDKKMIPEILDFHLRNKDFFCEWEDTKPADYYTAAYHAYLVKYEKQAVKDGTGIDFWIFRRDNLKLIGKAVMFGIAFGNVSNAAVGYKLDKDEQGCGFMHEALEGLVEFSFKDLNLHRLEINIVPRNVRSVRVAEALGFKLEGKSESFMRINGKWEDHLRYVKINEGYIEE